jgi:ATP-dependent Clp protease ATP-binding subunit ClpA
MFERFTDEARQVVVLAQEEARTLNHNYIGTEHILLGLLREEEVRPDVDQPLQSLGVNLRDARDKANRIVAARDEPTSGQIPFTPRSKKVLELALREALNLGHNYIGPEHILLGLALENEGVAARILLDFGVDSQRIRSRVIETVASRPPVRAASHAAAGRAARVPVDVDWLDGLQDVLQQLGREIRQELGRNPDMGDLLLAMASARDTLGGEALGQIGVDLDVLWGALEQIRQRRSEEGKALIYRLQQVRASKTEALEGQAFSEAAKLRDEERELVEQVHAQTSVGPQALREIRRRLGLPGSDG